MQTVSRWNCSSRVLLHSDSQVQNWGNKQSQKPGKVQATGKEHKVGKIQNIPESKKQNELKTPEEQTMNIKLGTFHGPHFGKLRCILGNRVLGGFWKNMTKVLGKWDDLAWFSMQIHCSRLSSSLASLFLLVNTKRSSQNCKIGKHLTTSPLYFQRLECLWCWRTFMASSQCLCVVTDGAGLKLKLLKCERSS